MGEKAVDVRGVLAANDLRPVVVLHEDDPHGLDVRSGLRERWKSKAQKRERKNRDDKESARKFHVHLRNRIDDQE